MTQNRILRLLSLAILCVLPACPAIVVYTDLASWQAVATQSGATIDFNDKGLSPGGYTTPVTSLSYAELGITFVAGTSETVQVRYADGIETWYQWGTGPIIRASVNVGTAGPMTVSLATPATAFAANMMIYNGASDSSMTVTLKSGAATLISPTLATSAQPTPTFFGVVSTDPGQTFDSIIFAPPSGSYLYTQLDNVRVGAYSDPAPQPEVPEPGTGFLVFGGVALLALGLIRKRR